MDMVHTRLYSFPTTLYFPSGQISLATLASLSSAQKQLLLSSLLPGTSLFNWQTTQAWLVTPKLPQQLVHLIHIAAMPAICCCSVTAAHQEARPLVLAVQVRNDRGRVTSQEQGNQWNSTHYIGSWSHIQAGCWKGLIQFGHPSTLHGPADGQFQLLKGAEEDQVVTEVIRAASVGCVLWGSPTRWMQAAGKEKLLTSKATIFQLNIFINILNAVRIRRDDKDGVLHTIKLEFQIELSTYIHEHCTHHVYT
jgi:hypothetical protein